MSTPAEVGKWLRNNDGNLPDAYRAVGYTGPSLKIKEGNLTTNRSKIRVAVRGDNGDTSRKFAESLNPPQTKEEQNQNRRQNYKRSSLRKQGKDVVIDHTVELDLTAQTVSGMSPAEAKKHIQKLEESYGPLGNRPQNRRIIGAPENELKRQQSKAVQTALSQMTGVPVIDYVLNNKPTPKPVTKPVTKTKPNAGVNLIVTAAGPQTKRNPTNRRPPRTLGKLTRVGNALDSRSSGSDIVDRVNGNMHLSNPYLAELGFELF